MHINGLLSQPVVGTDDQVTHTDTKRAYLSLLNNIMSSKLQGIFISDRKLPGLAIHVKVVNLSICSGNRPQLEALLGSMEQLAQDVADPSSQKAAFQFLGRCMTVWVQPTHQNISNGQQVTGLPGFERFVYERLVPAAFSVLASPQFNIKDGQMLVVSAFPVQASHSDCNSPQVLHEICNFLQLLSKARGEEAFDFFASAFLPAKNWPRDAATEFATKLRDLDSKAFKKYLADFVRASRS